MSAAAKTQSERIAQVLREDDASGPDALRRARLERQFLEAARQRDVAAASAPLASSRGARRRAAVFGGVAVVLAAAAALVVMLREAPQPSYAVRSAGAAAVTGGPIVAGTELALASGESASLTLFDLSTEVSERSRFRVEALSRDDVRVELSEGEARFAFHPQERGRQHVAIRTPSARVEIVGTELTVRVGEHGTEVIVHEGVVRVIPEVGEVALVHAGSSIAVPRVVAARAPELAPAAADGSAEASAPEAAPIEPPHEEISGMEESGTMAAGEGGTPSPVVAVADETTAPPSDEARLARAGVLLDRGERAAAERLLLQIAETAVDRADRAEAWQQLGESREAGHNFRGALAAYDQASELSRGDARDNALYARARFIDRRLHDAARARTELEAYLDEFPAGAHAQQATARLAELRAGAAEPAPAAE